MRSIRRFHDYIVFKLRTIFSFHGKICKNVFLEILLIIQQYIMYYTNNPSRNNKLNTYNFTFSSWNLKNKLFKNILFSLSTLLTYKLNIHKPFSDTFKIHLSYLILSACFYSFHVIQMINHFCNNIA